MRVKSWKRVSIYTVAVLLVLLLVAWGGLAHVVTGIARDELSNAEFERGYEHLPSDFGLAYENHTIHSDGLRLAAWWIPASEEADPDRREAPVIIVHGIGANMGHNVKRWGPNLHAAGHPVLSIDLRNHGASDDGPDGYVTYGAAESLDVLAALEYVRTNHEVLDVDPDRVFLYGGSMGAATVLAAAATQPPGLAGVIADSTFASLSFQAHLDGAARGYPPFLVDWVLKRMDVLAPANLADGAPEDNIPDVAAPLLLMHCENDVRVQVESFDRLVDLLPEGASTWREECPTLINENHHMEGWLVPGYNETVVSFTGRVL